MIYFAYAQGLGRVKVGYTADSPGSRLRDLRVGCPTELVILHRMPGEREDEKELHRQFAAERLHGEWFKYEGRVKQFLDGVLESPIADGVAFPAYRATLETMLRLWGDIVGVEIPDYEHASNYRASGTFDRDVERLLRWMRRHAEQGRQLRLDSAREKLEAL